MSCEKWLPLIEEFLDGEMDDSSIKSVRAHLASCGDCSTEYKQLLKEQELYQNYMRDIEVTPALWAGVHARIQQNGAGSGIFARIRSLASAFTAGPRLSPVYAMLLVIIAVAVTVIVMRRPTSPGTTGPANDGNPYKAQVTPAPPTPPSVPSQTGTPGPGPKETPKPGLQNGEPTIAKSQLGSRPPRAAARPAEPTAEQAVREAEQKYVAAIAILSRDVNNHRSELDPAVAAKFEATLASIDFTIRETRRAVREHPGDPVAAQYMLAAYSEKLDVLREMAGQ
jgi:hypothetical protein